MYSAEKAPLYSQNVHASYGRQAAVSPIHSVHFYEDDSLFLDSLAEFVGAALGAGGACLVIATPSHRTGLSERLKAHGIDVAYTGAMNRLIALDAAEVLSKFMVGGLPDRSRFFAAIQPEMLRARNSLQARSTSVVAFGEMVSLLWEGGQYDAAIALEKLWDQLAQQHAFSLRCAYPIGLFSSQAQYDLYRQVCSAHHQVIPSESYTRLDNENDRHRMISSLQQKAWTMQAVMRGREGEIARLKQVEARLHRSEEFARNIVEAGADCIQVLDLQGRMEYMSPPGLRSFELDHASAILGQPWVELWNPEDRPRAQAALATALAGGIGRFTGESASAGGTMVKWWDVSISPALDTERNIERLVAVSRDITEFRAAQQVAIESERQAGAGRMAATIAHEINNPLEAVTNFIFLALGSKGLPEHAARFLESADRELARAAQITRQMLSFYRGRSKPRWIRVAELMHDVTALCSRKLAGKHLTALISADPALELHAIDGELRQVLLNLTMNAIDASHRGGTIWLRARRTSNWKGDGDGVRITIADNGVGMSPEVKRRIFVPFYTTKGRTGTGIGLWITRCLVEQHSGYVHFRSTQENKTGTVMSLFLPCARYSTDTLAEVA